VEKDSNVARGRGVGGVESGPKKDQIRSKGSRSKGTISTRVTGRKKVTTGESCKDLRGRKKKEKKDLVEKQEGLASSGGEKEKGRQIAPVGGGRKKKNFKPHGERGTAKREAKLY